jgi:hypothetical protein
VSADALSAEFTIGLGKVFGHAGSELRQETAS